MFEEIVTHYSSGEIFLGLLLIFQFFPACVGLAYATVRHAILTRKSNKTND